MSVFPQPWMTDQSDFSDASPPISTNPRTNALRDHYLMMIKPWTRAAIIVFLHSRIPDKNMRSFFDMKLAAIKPGDEQGFLRLCSGALASVHKDEPKPKKLETKKPIALPPTLPGQSVPNEIDLAVLIDPKIAPRSSLVLSTILPSPAPNLNHPPLPVPPPIPREEKQFRINTKREVRAAAIEHDPFLAPPKGSDHSPISHPDHEPESGRYSLVSLRGFRR